MMQSCCEDIAFVGCFGSCSEIPLLIESDYTGTATLQFDWMGKRYNYEVIVVEGEQIVLPNLFNETSSVVFRLQKPDGSFFSLGNESESQPTEPITCFLLKNSLQINISNISGSIPPQSGNLQIVTTVFAMAENESVLNIGGLAVFPFQLYINGVLQTSPAQYTLLGSVVAIVDPPLDFPYEITILTFQYA
jgi:hypothetical protein